MMYKFALPLPILGPGRVSSATDRITSVIRPVSDLSGGGNCTGGGWRHGEQGVSMDDAFLSLESHS